VDQIRRIPEELIPDRKRVIPEAHKARLAWRWKGEQRGNKPFDSLLKHPPSRQRRESVGTIRSQRKLCISVATHVPSPRHVLPRPLSTLQTLARR
jgi:hypothetical protein